MSVRRRKGRKTFEFDFSIKRRRFFGATGATTKRDAIEVEREQREAARALLAAEARAGRGLMSLDEAAGKFWLERGAAYRGNAAKTFFASLKWIVERAAIDADGRKRLVKDLSNAIVAELVARRRGEGVSNATVNRTVTEPLRRILLRARDAWDQPIPNIDWGRHLLAEPKERVRELTELEEQKLFASLRRDYHELVRFALLSGCRLDECVSLAWSAIDWGGRRILVTGKGNRTDPIPLSAALRELLWPLQGRHPEKVFCYAAQAARDGRRRGSWQPVTYQGAKTAWRRARALAGLTDFRFHDARHTAATRLLRATGNLVLVQKLLRHEDIATTRRYAHASDEDLRAGMDKAAAAAAASANKEEKRG